MAYSSILGADSAPIQPSGRGSDLLGPSDSSDTGSDALGTQEIQGDSDAAGTGERGDVSGADIPDGADILPDHIVNLGPAEQALASGQGFADNDVDAQEFTDLDADGQADAPEEGADR